MVLEGKARVSLSWQSHNKKNGPDLPPLYGRSCSALAHSLNTRGRLIDASMGHFILCPGEQLMCEKSLPSLGFTLTRGPAVLLQQRVCVYSRPCGVLCFVQTCAW